MLAIATGVLEPYNSLRIGEALGTRWRREREKGGRPKWSTKS